MHAVRDFLSSLTAQQSHEIRLGSPFLMRAKNHLRCLMTVSIEQSLNEFTINQSQSINLNQLINHRVVSKTNWKLVHNATLSHHVRALQGS
jgi:hypothetical protein